MSRVGRPKRRRNKCYMGHKLTPENSYIKATGYVECRTCARQSWRAYYHRKKKVSQDAERPSQ